MKKFLSLLVIMSFGLMAQATIHNVDNNPNRPAGYYGNLQLAINSASEGDTIYLYPSNTTYGQLSIDKELHLFGKGYDGTTGYVSRCDYIYLDTATSPASNPSQSSFQGLTFSGLICNKPNITNIKVLGNYITGYISLANNCSGWLIANNYFQSHIDLGYNSNILITNNIFKGNTHAIYYANSPSIVFTHNLVMTFQYFYNVNNITVSDNIFVCTGAPNTDYMARNIFTNNISWRTTLNPYTMPPAGNSGSGNISNQDPQFETAPSAGSFDPSKDYHLKTTSPGKNAATDGTDIGPYGGVRPFVWGGDFTIPKITQVNITNPVINVSTPINTNVKATKAGY